MVNIIPAEHQRVSIVSIAFLSSNSSASMCVYIETTVCLCLLVCQDMYQQAADIKMYMRHHLFRLCVYAACARRGLRGISGT